MSQKRVITGTDDRGRPISRWEDPEPQGSSGYGFMEPAYDATTIERRQATPDELAAARARDEAAPYLPKRSWTPDDITELRAATGAVTGEETIRAMQEAGGSPEEEAAMPTDDTEPTAAAPDEEVAQSPLHALAAASLVAARRQRELRAAQVVWTLARAALDDAIEECRAYIDPEPPPAAGATEPEVLERLDRPGNRADGVRAEPASLKRLRQPGRHEAHAGEAAARAERARRVTEAVARHGGDRSAAAAELGMRPNAVAMVLKFADRRAEATA